MEWTSFAPAVTAEFDAREEAASHRAEVLLPLRKALVVASSVLIAFGGAILLYQLYHFSIVGAPPSSQLPFTATQLVGAAALVAIGVYLLAQCAPLKRPLPTLYVLDSDGFTAKWDNGTALRLSWDDPRLRLFMRDLRDLLDVKGCTTLISKSGSFVPFAVPSKMYDRVLSEVKTLGLVTSARYYRGRGGLLVHTATVRGKKRG
jgi:hypothetical protein